MLTLYNKKKFIFTKKIIAQKVIGILKPKYYLRAIFSNFVLDNFNQIYKIKFDNFKIGNSFSINNFKYINKYNKSLKFSYFFKNAPKISKYSDNLFNIFQNTENHIIILKPILGGLKIYSLGIKGFLPQNEIYFLRKFSKTFLKNIFTLSFISFNSFRLRLYLPNYKRMHFSKLSKKKKYRLHSFNLIFKL